MRFGLKYHEIYYKKGIYWPLTSLAFYSFINGKFMKSEGLFRTALMMLDTVKEILFYFFLQESQNIIKYIYIKIN
jgi:hypothetical protein